MTARPFALLAGTLVVAVGLSVWALRATATPAPERPVAAGRLRPQGDLLVAALPEPSHLNALTTLDPAVRTWVLRLTHDGLCDLDPRTGEVRPALATAIEDTADGGVRVTLRAGARFADGTALTADDVVFSHRCARGPGLPGSALVRAAAMVEALEAVAPQVVIGKGLAPHWSARHVFTTGMLVLSRAAVLQRVRVLAARKGMPAPEPFGREFTALLAELPDLGPGSGPYVLAPGDEPEALWARGRHLDLVANPLCWRRDEQPAAWNLAGLRYLFVAEPQAQVALARRQQIDWLGGDVHALAADSLLARHYRTVVYDPATLGPLFVAWNCRRPPLADVRVRRALAMLFDRDAIVQQVLHGAGVSAAAWFEPDAADVPSGLVAPGYDAAAAAAELRAAGFGNGGPALRITVLGAAGEPLHRQVLELAQAWFRAAGVELVPELVEGGVLRDRLQRQEFEGLLALKYHPDPWVDPWPHFHGSQAVAGGQNWMGLRDAEVDRVLDAARGERDPEQRAALYREFCRRVHELQPVALLAHPRTALLLHRRFRDAEVGPTGLSPERWWVPAEEQLHRVRGAR